MKNIPNPAKIESIIELVIRVKKKVPIPRRNPIIKLNNIAMKASLSYML